jgi:plasmid maintenance system antidote protein VapI
MHLKHFSLTALEAMTGIDRHRISRIFNGASITERTIDHFVNSMGLSRTEVYAQIEQIRAEKAKAKTANIKKRKTNA